MRHAVVTATTTGLCDVTLDGATVPDVPVSGGATAPVGQRVLLLQEGRRIVAVGWT